MKEILKIGLLAPLSGIASLHGEKIVQAIARLKDTLEVELDICLEVTIADDGSQPSLPYQRLNYCLNRARLCLSRLLCQTQDWLYFTVLQVKQTYHLSTLLTTREIFTLSSFRTSPIINQILLPTLAHLTQLYGYKIFVAAQNYDWPRQANLHLKEHLKNIGVDVIGEHFSNFEQHQYTLLISEILTSSANILVLLYFGEPLVELLEYLDLNQVIKKMEIFSTKL